MAEAFPVEPGEDIQLLKDKIRGVRKRLGEISPMPPGDIFSTLKNKIFQIDPETLSTGVRKFGFRAGLSRGDTPAERERYLDQVLGPEGWSLDTFGRYVANPKGIERLGLPKVDKPVRIDEPSLTKFDIADLLGEAPALGGGIGGAVGGGVLGTAVGGPGLGTAAGAIIGSGLGAGAGKAAGELGEQIAGENIQPFGEVAKDVASEALLGAAGEGVMRGVLMPLGRRALGPSAQRMTPESRQLMKEAEQIGARPGGPQVTKAPLLLRGQSMMDTIFGDIKAKQNIAALNNEVNRLKTSVYPKSIDMAAAGEAVKKDISSARRALATWSEGVSNKIDTMTGGLPVIPTANLKQAARDILKGLPKHRETGEPLFTAPETRSAIAEITEGLGDSTSVEEMTRTINRLWQAVDDTTILPGIASHDARALWKAARSTLEDAGKFPGGQLKNAKQIQQTIKSFRKKYAQEIQKFDNSLVSRIMRDERFAGSLAPEEVVGKIFRKKLHTPLKRVMGIVTPETRQKIQKIAMDDLVDSLIQRTDDPLVDAFNGKNFLNTLDKYGREPLEAMFGKAKMEDLYRLGRVTSLVTARAKLSGGIVAANIALHPWVNLGKLVQLRLLAQFMRSKAGVRYLTEGIRAPRTRAGVAALGRAITLSELILDEHTRETDAISAMLGVQQ